MAERILNTFIKGMIKDVDYSLVNSQQYLHAENLRGISSGFNTTGALENIKGNRFIGNFEGILEDVSLTDNHVYLVTIDRISYNGGVYMPYTYFTCSPGINSFTGSGVLVDITNYNIPIDHYIVGGRELRDGLILFTTTNTSSTPNGGVSRIYKLILTGDNNESISSLNILYDDSLNVDGSYLNFSVANPIKAISKYETPNIEKVYWVDSYNNLRYINTSNNCTIDGSVYSSNNYWGVDKFEFLPSATLVKPTITGVTQGNINTGMVFYAYRLLMKNGATSAISPISNPIHVTTSDDYLSTDLNYKGDDLSNISSKGFILNIDLTGNDSFSKVQLLRVHYASYNTTPIITIAAESNINTIGNITLVDIGSSYGELTVDEFNISSTELFSCEDITSKDNILFAANISNSTFDIDNFDSRVVRFRNYSETIGGSDLANCLVTDDGGLAVNYIDEYTVSISISNYKSNFGISSTRNITSIDYVLADSIYISYAYGGNSYTTDISVLADSTSNIVDNGLGTLSFYATWSEQLFVGIPTIVYLESPITIGYSYEASGSSTVESIIIDANLGNRVIDSSLSNWSIIEDEHDCINNYNNPDNDFDTTYQFKYQSNGKTIGAEGPNILIGIDYEDFVIDDIRTNEKSYSVNGGDNSFDNYASIFNAGKLSWQRDEVYRLFIVFTNNRGQKSNMKWLCDFRMPSLNDSIYGVISKVGSTSSETVSRRIFPTIKIKDGCWPTEAVSAQIYRCLRNRVDRQVVTQAVVLPSVEEHDVTGSYTLYDYDLALDTFSSNNANIVKLVSPEILINKNISKRTNDYLEYVSNYNSVTTNWLSTTNITTSGHFYYLKGITNTVKTSLVANDRSDITDLTLMTPITKSGVGVSLGSYTFKNYNFANNTSKDDAKGCTGIGLQYTNNSFNIEGKVLPIVNYKCNCWNSQYNGNTYEARINNSAVPCSDLILLDNTTYNCEYGDTFINYLDIAQLLFDIDIANDQTGAWAKSAHASLYLPFESSINCNLRYDKEGFHILYDNLDALLQQEESGAYICTNNSTGTSRMHEQKYNMYSYNPVYSQQPLLASQISVDESITKETVFDCQIKASSTKLNGESVDSWTIFPIIDFIEVDSEYGSINAINNYNGKVYFWQDKSFGGLSINERVTIQDSSSSKLALGTGGKLERYDYISLLNGCKDKFSVVGGSAGLYWIDRDRKAINRISDSISDLTSEKQCKSIFLSDKSIPTWGTYIGCYDKENFEVLFTIADYTSGIINSTNIGEYKKDNPFTICFSELNNSFTSFYSFIPYVYIPYKNTFLTATTYNYLYSNNVSNIRGCLFIHNVDESIQTRNSFYGFTYGDIYSVYPSKLTLLFNQYYNDVKVFDNISLTGNLTYYPISNTIYKKDYAEHIDNYECPISNISFINSYQYTGKLDIPADLEFDRREKSIWNSYIPRNAVSTDYDDQYLNPELETIVARSTYQERMRDNYLICKLETPVSNSATYSQRVVLENVGVTYRSSKR